MARPVGEEAVPAELSASPRFYGIRTRRSPPREFYRKQTTPEGRTSRAGGGLAKSSSDEGLSGLNGHIRGGSNTDSLSNSNNRRSDSADTITARTNLCSDDNNYTTTRTKTCCNDDSVATDVALDNGSLMEQQQPQTNNNDVLIDENKQIDAKKKEEKRGDEYDDIPIVTCRQNNKQTEQQHKLQRDGRSGGSDVCLGGLRGHICPPIAMEQTMWEVLEPYGCQQCLDSIKASGCDTTVHIGLWSDQAISCGMPLPTGLSFIDEFVAKNFTPLQLLTVRDKYLTELKTRFPIWLNTLETDEGWKYHGTKNGNVFHRREPKGEPPIIRGRLNMGSALSLQDYNDINMDRDFYYNLYKDSKSLKHFKPAVTWAGSLEQPWFLNLSWLCYNGFPPIVSDREVLTASLVVFLDKHTTVTVSMSVDDFCIDFPERPKTSIPVQLGAVFRTRQFPDNTVEHCGVVQASMKLLVPQCIFIRSSLFTQPVDWPLVMQYAQSDKGRAAIGKHPVCSLIKEVAEGIDSRSMWLEGKVLKGTQMRREVKMPDNKDIGNLGDGGVCRSVSTNSGGDITESEEDENRFRFGKSNLNNCKTENSTTTTTKKEESDKTDNQSHEPFDPWLELQSVTAETLCEYAWQKKLIDVGGSGYGCVSGQQ
eukprot:GHVS01089910.1.p1 GENE.GHVS01089910.1~~GHVS01089910.1.p1  ORF type:complete len:649 (+),score=118.98 GHVS01089910.1:794-2740(+)